MPYKYKSCKNHITFSRDVSVYLVSIMKAATFSPCLFEHTDSITAMLIYHFPRLIPSSRLDSSMCFLDAICAHTYSLIFYIIHLKKKLFLFSKKKSHNIKEQNLDIKNLLKSSYKKSYCKCILCRVCYLTSTALYLFRYNPAEHLICISKNLNAYQSF